MVYWSASTTIPSAVCISDPIVKSTHQTPSAPGPGSHPCLCSSSAPPSRAQAAPSSQERWRGLPLLRAHARRVRGHGYQTCGALHRRLGRHAGQGRCVPPWTVCRASAQAAGSCVSASRIHPGCGRSRQGFDSGCLHGSRGCGCRAGGGRCLVVSYSSARDQRGSRRVGSGAGGGDENGGYKGWAIGASVSTRPNGIVRGAGCPQG